jgi:hypothetical protein
MPASLLKKKKEKRDGVFSLLISSFGRLSSSRGTLGGGGGRICGCAGGGEVECWEVSVKRDLIHRQKRPTIIASVSKET